MRLGAGVRNPYFSSSSIRREKVPFIHLTRLHFHSRSFCRQRGVLSLHSLTKNVEGTRGANDFAKSFSPPGLAQNVVMMFELYIYNIRQRILFTWNTYYNDSFLFVCVQSQSIPGGLRPRTVRFQLHHSSER